MSFDRPFFSTMIRLQANLQSRIPRSQKKKSLRDAEVTAGQPWQTSFTETQATAIENLV